MRIVYHLNRSASGRWSFVQRVPTDLQSVLGCRLIKRTLRTGDVLQVHLRAVRLTADYAHRLAMLGNQRVSKLGRQSRRSELPSGQAGLSRLDDI
jgi:hypothetical protein